MVTFEINFDKNYQPKSFKTISLFCSSETQLLYNASVNSSCAQPPPPPPGYCRAFARLVSPWGGAFGNFALPGGRAFASPGAIPELLTRTQFPITI